MVSELLRRRVWTVDDAVERLRAAGIREEDARPWAERQWATMDPWTILDLYRREAITEREARRMLQAAGYRREEQDRWLVLRDVMPTPQTVISWAVRDVFEPQVVEHFGYDDEFPAEFAEWCRKVGIPEEQARYYWWAHWELPGLGTVLDMYHRIRPDQRHLPRESRETWVTDEDLDVYMRTADYPPWWRERIKAVSYLPMSRVDIRRAYEWGLADAEDLYETNRALGYDHRTSEILTAWTAIEYPAPHTRQAMALVRRLYPTGDITRAQAEQALRATDLPDEAVETLLDEMDLERMIGTQELSRSTVADMYIRGVMDEAEARDRLTLLGYGAQEVDLWIERWDLDRERRSRIGGGTEAHPTKSEVLRLLREGIITEAECREELEWHGYDERYQTWYIIEVLDDIGLDEAARRWERGALRSETLRAWCELRGYPCPTTGSEEGE